MSVVSLARELAAIPSHEDATRTGDAIAAWLRTETDAEVRRDDVGNVIARRGRGPSLALVGHHDVVPPDESQLDVEGYLVTERDGRLIGRGTADMKGAIAAMLHAFRDAEPPGALVFASFVGEEAGGEGARHAIDHGFGPAYAVVGEGSTGYSARGVTDVAIAHKGRRASTIRARGRSAHASEAGAGENAIYHACEAICRLRTLPVPATTVHGQPIEGSLAVTEITGGAAWNVIPATCTVTVDERTVPGETVDLDRLETIEGVTVEVNQTLPPMACDDPAFIDTVLKAATAVQEAPPATVVKPHATDAGWLSQAGTTCVVCGPAEPGEAHTAEESVSIAVLDRCRDLYRSVADSWSPNSD